MESRLRAALPPPERWALWREPEPAAALLSVPGDHEAGAGRHSGAVSGIAARDRPRSQAARYSLRGRRLGKPDARRVGPWLGSVVRRDGSLAVHLFPAG